MATITGTTGNNTINGDTTLPGTFNDSLSGGDGNDIINGLTANDTLNGDAGNDQLFGGSGDDLLIGGTGRDGVFGGTGNDYIYESDFAGGQNNSGSGRDTIDGGDDSDTIDFTFAPEGITVVLASGSATINPTGDNNTDVLIGIENIVGTNFGDNITGDTVSNYLSGGGGNDVISGGLGNDTIAGGAGNDTLSGGDGTDTLTYANSASAVTANLGLGTATGEGIDPISGFENLIGSVGSDNLTGSDEANVIEGGAGNDTVLAGGGADTVFGGAGNDSLSGGDANDTIDGGIGNDTVDGGSGDDLIYGGSAAPVGTTFIFNGAFNDSGAGWTGTDLEFNPESSYFGGGSGINFVSEIDGNSGLTTVMNQSFSVDGPVSAKLTFRGILRTQGTVGTDGYRVEVLDSGGGVILTQEIKPGSNVLPNWTNYSFDVQFPASGTYTLRFTEFGNGDSLGALVDDVQITSTTVLEDGADLLNGGDGNDAIFGGFGNDTLDGGADNDLLDGGIGNDLLQGGSGNDNLTGGLGDDTLQGGANGDVLSGGDGNDLLLGDSGADNIDGGAGDDSIEGGADNDTVVGGVGNDTILGEGGDDLLIGEDGNDSIDGGIGNDALFGGSGNDIIDGGLDNDTISGGIGNDTVFGDEGNDVFAIGLNDVTTLSGVDVDDETVVPPYEVIYGGGGIGTAPGDNDTIDLSAFGFSRVIIVRDSNIVTEAGYENGYIKILDTAGNEIGRIDFFNIENIAPCFTPGVMILTDRGEVPVEALVAGDLVMTRDSGLQPLRWVGRRDLSLLDLMADPDLQPVQIAQGALDGAGPARNMLVSPQHRVLIEGSGAELLFGEAEVLVAAKHLLGRAGVTRVLPREGVSYIHILFDRHEIVQSDGIWTESFQPADRMLSAMDAEVRQEVLVLFPELARKADAFPAARLSLKAHEAQVLLAH